MAASKSTSKRKASPAPASKPRTRAKAKPSPTNRTQKAKAAAKVERTAKAKPKKSDAQTIVGGAPAVSAPSVYQLPERLDSSTAASVLANFKAHRGRMIVVDASNVRRVGAQPLQILVSAARTWQADGHDYTLLKPSNELIEAATLLGLSASELSVSGQWQ